MAFVSFGLMYLIVFTASVRAGQGSSERPQYVNKTNLARPSNYREWVFISSGLGMDYGSRPGESSAPRFSNVFVNPTSYRTFMKTGKWPDQTTFVLEIRGSASEGSINKAGRFQSNLAMLEAEVKDSRFPDGWAYFNFGQGESLKDSSEPLPVSAGCVECHTQHTAVERTFVQFYPTLLDVARKMGTVKPGF
ncbi:MAG: cytochrome P460 [Blastocatellia bacterium]|nr:MAG: cytochrome P460 [Blastocatellia bacterium]